MGGRAKVDWASATFLRCPVGNRPKCDVDIEGLQRQDLYRNTKPEGLEGLSSLGRVWAPRIFFGCVLYGFPGRWSSNSALQVKPWESAVGGTRRDYP